jgi:hypothetical protein
MIAVLYASGLLLTYMSAVCYHFWRLTRPDDMLSLPGNWQTLVSNAFYINLSICPERERHMTDLMKRIGIPCERFNAVDGSDAALKYPDVMIPEKDVGIKLSHMGVLGETELRGWTLVFEDDVTLLDNRILKYLDDMPGTAKLAHFGIDPWSVLWCVLTFRFRRVSNGVWSTSYPTRCKHAYAITRSGAEKWLKEIETNFYEFPLNKHGYGIDRVYVCHKMSDMWDMWKVLTLQDVSYVRQDKEQFGYMPLTSNSVLYTRIPTL